MSVDWEKTFLTRKVYMYPKYLTKNKSNTSYYYISYIPKDLLCLFDGKIRFRISLKCGNKVISKKICLHRNQITKQLDQLIRMGKSLTIDEMKRILQKEVEKSKKHSSYFSYVGVDRSNKMKVQEGLDRLDREEKQLKERNLDEK